MCSKGGETEDLRIIASISWGCVGVGNGGISQSSSQSNGIYVQHSGLQQGNKCFSLLQPHVLIPSAPILCASLSLLVTFVSSISVSLSYCLLLSILFFSIFCFMHFLDDTVICGKSAEKKKGSSATMLLCIAYTVAKAVLRPFGILFISQ